jgi:hypothetical protein
MSLLFALVVVDCLVLQVASGVPGTLYWSTARTVQRALVDWSHVETVLFNLEHAVGMQVHVMSLGNRLEIVSEALATTLPMCGTSSTTPVRRYRNELIVTTSERLRASAVGALGNLIVSESTTVAAAQCTSRGHVLFVVDEGLQQVVRFTLWPIDPLQSLFLSLSALPLLDLSATTMTLSSVLAASNAKREEMQRSGGAYWSVLQVQESLPLTSVFAATQLTTTSTCTNDDPLSPALAFPLVVVVQQAPGLRRLVLDLDAQ